MNDLQEWGEMKLESPRGWIWADFGGVGDAESESDSSEEEKEELNRWDSDPRRRMPVAHPPATTIRRDNASSDSENENNIPPPDTAMQLDPATTTSLTQLTPNAPLDLLATTPALTRPTPRLPFATLTSPNNAPRPFTAREPRPKMPVLRAHLLQIKILENHQNGKDTHLRGLQVFARNDEERGRAEPMTREMGGKSMGMGLEMDGKGKKGLVRRGGREKWDLGPGSRSAWDVEPSVR